MKGVFNHEAKTFDKAVVLSSGVVGTIAETMTELDKENRLYNRKRSEIAEAVLKKLDFIATKEGAFYAGVALGLSIGDQLEVTDLTNEFQ